MKKLIVLTIVIIVFLISSVTFLGLFLKEFDVDKDAPKAYKKDPTYCEKDSDCKAKSRFCSSINIYHYERFPSNFGCERTTCGALCENNICKMNGDCASLI